MNYAEQEVQRLGEMLKGRLEDGDVLIAEFQGRPDLRIHSMTPLSYETYTFFRRGPLLIGEFAIKGLLFNDTENNEHRIRVFLAFSASTDIYATRVAKASDMNRLGQNITDDPSYDFFEPRS